MGDGWLGRAPAISYPSRREQGCPMPEALLPEALRQVEQLRGALLDSQLAPQGNQPGGHKQAQRPDVPLDSQPEALQAEQLQGPTPTVLVRPAAPSALDRRRVRLAIQSGHSTPGRCFRQCRARRKGEA